MKNLWLKLKIRYYQVKGRSIQRRMTEIEDGYNCGYHILMNVNYEYAQLDRELDRVMNVLRGLMG